LRGVSLSVDGASQVSANLGPFAGQGLGVPRARVVVEVAEATRPLERVARVRKGFGRDATMRDIVFEPVDKGLGISVGSKRKRNHEG
jgi:hypothetical protein